MAGHNADRSSPVRASTIALLQESFKKLQRVREMREAEREVIQYRSTPPPPPPQSPQPNWLFPVSSPGHAGGGGSGHHHHQNHRGREVPDTSLSVGLWPRRSSGAGGDQGSVMISTSGETDAVDTSLHL